MTNEIKKRGRPPTKKTLDTCFKYLVGGQVFETSGDWGELPIFLELTPEKVKSKVTVIIEKDSKRGERTYFPMQFKKILSNNLSRQVAFKQIAMLLK